MNMISIEKLTYYLRGYDETFGGYPESDYEGEALLEWILECGGLL
jgi:hypothetical protein